jgi:hypothetical protein
VTGEEVIGSGVTAGLFLGVDNRVVIVVILPDPPRMGSPSVKGQDHEQADTYRDGKHGTVPAEKRTLLHRAPPFKPVAEPFLPFWSLLEYTGKPLV